MSKDKRQIKAHNAANCSYVNGIKNLRTELQNQPAKMVDSEEIEKKLLAIWNAGDAAYTKAWKESE